MIAGIIESGLKIIDKVIPDPEQKAEAQRKLIEMQQAGELKELEIQMSAILTEAQSQDPWTSRARPSFLYVMYAMILACIPMGMFFMVDPDNAKEMIGGVKLWLDSIPGEMWTLFGVGYLGYVKKRSDDKAVSLGKEPKGWLREVVG